MCFSKEKEALRGQSRIALTLKNYECYLVLYYAFKCLDKSVFMYKTKQLCINSCAANASLTGTGGGTNRLGNDLLVQQTKTT